MSQTPELEHLSQQLYQNKQLHNERLNIATAGRTFQIRSNNAELLQRLKNYFSHIVTSDDRTDIVIVAIEGDSLNLDITFNEWRREPGKQNRKDSYYDFPGGRLLRKVRTGMVFLQSAQQRIASGPCMQNDNQVINFINAQIMNALQQRGWLICHAAGFTYHDQAIAIAGFSGGGKSTLMLHMLEDERFNFLSNDRLFVQSVSNQTHAAGIPKQPRINPGTIVHNKRLHPLISESRRETLLAMAPSALWELEEKYDAMIPELYGPNRICTETPKLTQFIVLNWQHDSTEPTSLKPIDLNQRPDLLAAIVKSPGPFYQDERGDFLTGSSIASNAQYERHLEHVAMYEAKGKIDFDSMRSQIEGMIRNA